MNLKHGGSYVYIYNEENKKNIFGLEFSYVTMYTKWKDGNVERGEMRHGN